MALTLKLYQYTGETNKINKTLGTSTDKTGEQVDNYNDLVNPSFIINYTGSTAPQYNYCYIASYNRYYWITRTTWVGGTAYQIDCHVDVLKTYHSQIDSLTAMIGFSALGDRLERDKRLNEKDYITRYVSNTETYYHKYKDSTSGQTPWILLRYHYIPPRQSAPGVPASSASSIRFTIMDAASWSDFLAIFVSAHLTDAQREAVAKAIIDVSELYYIDATRLASSTLEFSSSTVVFTTPEYPSGITISTTDYGGNDTFYTSTDPIADVNSLGVYTVPAFEIPYAEYQFVNATYRTHLPFAGDVDFIPSKMGIYQPWYGWLDIKVDPLGNQYVCRIHTTDGSGTDIPKYYDDHLKTLKNPRRRGFFYNDSLNRAEWNKLGLYVSAAQGMMRFDVAAPFRAYTNEMELDARTAAATEYRGDFGDALDDIMNRKIYNVSNRTDYDTDQYQYWTAYGYPDHQIRTISSISDGTYFECEKVSMAGFSTATKEEADEIERELLRGVYA